MKFSLLCIDSIFNKKKLSLTLILIGSTSSTDGISYIHTIISCYVMNLIDKSLWHYCSDLDNDPKLDVVYSKFVEAFVMFAKYLRFNLIHLIICRF